MGIGVGSKHCIMRPGITNLASAMTGTALNVVSFLFLGFFLGMRHATDADHVVAIATIVSRERSVAGSALIRAAWGVRHTITLMPAPPAATRVLAALPH